MKRQLAVGFASATTGSIVFVMMNLQVIDASPTWFQILDQVYFGGFIGLFLVDVILSKRSEVFVLGFVNLLIYCVWGLLVELPLGILFNVGLSPEVIVIGRCSLCVLGSTVLIWRFFPIAPESERDADQSDDS